MYDSDTGRPLEPDPVEPGGGELSRSHSWSPLPGSAVDGEGVTKVEARAAGIPRMPSTASPSTRVNPTEGKALETEPTPSGGSIVPLAGAGCAAMDEPPWPCCKDGGGQSSADMSGKGCPDAEGRRGSGVWVH